MTLKEFIRKKVLAIIGLAKQEDKPDPDRLTFINDDERLGRMKIHEYNIWYGGDGDELLNFYTHQNTFEYNFEPFYTRNKKNYFWAISSTESDIKRTHSGQPRNIVDTLTNIIAFPLVRAGKLEDDNNIVNKNLQKVIEETRLEEIYSQEQLPLTMIEGWGCYKINWDKDVSPYPIVVYYRAENVDFIYKYNRITGVIFRDYYTDGDKRHFMLAETRHLRRTDEGTTVLCIENQLFETGIDGDFIKPVKMWEVPELAGVEEYNELPFDCLLATPCILFKNTSATGGPGRSIFTGKIDLFDDLDQCLSQGSNAVRKSTPVEYFNTDYLERDKNGMPKQPKAFDRKYTIYQGIRNADGNPNSSDPVFVTQPNVNFEQYSNEAVQILMQIINGILSPATIGIDIAKKDNAEAQREKEKVTIFTRNGIIREETKILKNLFVQILKANEYLISGKVTVLDYDISIKFSEFADDSFENKLEKLGAAFNDEDISEEMYMQKLYGDTLSPAEYNKELDWLKEHHTKPKDDGMLGMGGGGSNAEGGPNSMLGNMLGGEDDETEL